MRVAVVSAVVIPAHESGIGVIMTRFIRNLSYYFVYS